MNLYLISQDEVTGWDIYKSAVVAALSEDDARNVHPSGSVTHIAGGVWMNGYSEYEPFLGDDWPMYCDIACIKVEFLGRTIKERGVILASFIEG